MHTPKLRAVDTLHKAARSCSRCAHQAHDRRYLQLHDRVLCEHCLLDVRKLLAGLVGDHPYEPFVESLAAALDLRESETGLHSKRVAAHTVLLSRHCYSDDDMQRSIYWGSLLHDIGKIGVPDAVLLKPGALDADEWQIMRQHPQNGSHILEKMPVLSVASQIVLCHEERYDGRGYPAGLSGDEIPLPARLFAVIDTLDAMTFDRPYRRAMPFDAAKAEILRMSGSQFDPFAVELFLREESVLREISTLPVL